MNDAALRRIWLCADDYGLAEGVNRAIRDLISHGRLNATSVMVVGPAIGRAEVAALQEAAANKFACSLADLDHVNALGKDLIAVLVDIRSHGRDVQVFGSCQIADNEIDCAVKAALNATNRMFELATREQ